MATAKGALSFDDIIQADRQRKKNEALANEIFGRGRKTEPSRATGHKFGTGPSLASRVGIAKTSQRSNSNTPKPRGNPGAALDHENSTTRGPRVTRPARDNPMLRSVKDDLFYEAATGKATRNGAGAGAISRGGPGPELSIRGAAGPYVVIGSNFAPGTTSADIESAMLPVGGEMQSCRILTAAPTVMAEMVFSDKGNAEAVIDTFNNKKADGRILHLYLKRGPPSVAPVAPVAPVHKAPTEPKISAARAPATDLTRSDTPSSYDAQRERSDRSRRQAEPEVQDGSYGFENKNDQMDVDMDAPVPLGITPPRSDRRDGRAYDRRDDRYSAPRDYGRGRYDERDWGGGRPQNDRRLYSDDLYPRSRGRGFR